MVGTSVGGFALEWRSGGAATEGRKEAAVPPMGGVGRVAAATRRAAMAEKGREGGRGGTLAMGRGKTYFSTGMLGGFGVPSPSTPFGSSEAFVDPIPMGIRGFPTFSVPVERVSSPFVICASAMRSTGCGGRRGFPSVRSSGASLVEAGEGEMDGSMPFVPLLGLSNMGDSIFLPIREPSCDMAEDIK